MKLDCSICLLKQAHTGKLFAFTSLCLFPHFISFVSISGIFRFVSRRQLCDIEAELKLLIAADVRVTHQV